MADRTVTDSNGRTWTCAVDSSGEGQEASQGRDVVLACVTPSLPDPVHITVGWQWEKMAPAGLARMLTQASPAPKR